MNLDDTDKAFIEETFEDPEWSTADIAETLETSVYRVYQYAKSQGLRRPGRRVDTSIKKFISDTYPDPEWTVAQIADHLDMSESLVRGHATYMGLKRPCVGAKKHNWRQIWHTTKEVQSTYKAAEVLGISRGAVWHAMTRMRVMTPEERETLWKKRGFK